MKRTILLSVSAILMTLLLALSPTVGATENESTPVSPALQIIANHTPIAKAGLAANEIQKCVNLNGGKAMVKVNLKKTRPAGKYSLWNCFRISNKIEYFRVVADLPQGGNQEIFRHLNTATELLKSKFYGDNDRGKFTWTCPNLHYYTYPALEMGDDFNTLNYRVVISREKYIELAGTIILPYPDEDFLDAMVETLCGLNHNKWYIEENNSKQ